MATNNPNSRPRRPSLNKIDLAAKTEQTLKGLKENLRESSSPTTRQETLTTLTTLARQDHTPKDRLCDPCFLNLVLEAFFTVGSPSSTTSATKFLFYLSSHPRTRSIITNFNDRALIHSLLNALTNIEGNTPNGASVKAAYALNNLVLSEENKNAIGSIPGLIPSLANTWMDQSLERDVREGAGMVLVELMRSNGGNVRRLLEGENEDVVRILGVARDKREGRSEIREMAFRILSLIGRLGGNGLEVLMEGSTMEWMSDIMKEEPLMGEKCMDVMWRMCARVESWEERFMC